MSVGLTLRLLLTADNLLVIEIQPIWIATFAASLDTKLAVNHLLLLKYSTLTNYFNLSFSFT